jgi:hypothetical protein
MVLTVSFVLSPVTGLFCHRRSQIITCELDTSVGAPGPHDFFVRIGRVRLTEPSRPSHPAPNVRDDREAPLLWVRTRESVELICPTAQAKYFCEGDWTTQINLNRLKKLSFSRMQFRSPFTPRMRQRLKNWTDLLVRLQVRSPKPVIRSCGSCSESQAIQARESNTGQAFLSASAMMIASSAEAFVNQENPSAGSN